MSTAKQRSLLRQKTGTRMAQEYIRTSQIVWGWKLQLPRTEVLKQLSDRCCRAKEMPGFRVMLDLVVEGLGDCFPFRAAIYIVQQKKKFVCKNREQKDTVRQHRWDVQSTCQAEHLSWIQMNPGFVQVRKDPQDHQVQPFLQLCQDHH